MKIEGLVTRKEYELALDILKRAQENRQLEIGYISAHDKPFDPRDLDNKVSFVDPMAVISREEQRLKSEISMTRNKLLDLEIKKDGIQRFLESDT